MKALKLCGWLLTLVAISLPACRLYAQQEIDPDHFEQQAAQVQKVPSVHHQNHAHRAAASKSKHHHAHASA